MRLVRLFLAFVVLLVFGWSSGASALPVNNPVTAGLVAAYEFSGNADDGTVSLQQLWHHRRALSACWGWSIPCGSAAQPLLRAQLHVELLSPPGATAAAHRTLPRSCELLRSVCI